jgi:hypothetical protein
VPHKDPEARRAYHREYAKKWREEHPEQYRERRAKWNAANRDKNRGYTKKYYELHREQEIIRQVRGNARRYRRLRLEALQYYGGQEPECACCGEWHLSFLALDHIAGGGTQHRKDLNAASLNIWEFLRREEYPIGYRVLCHNCNGARGYYGSCPHEDERANPATESADPA